MTGTHAARLTISPLDTRMWRYLAAHRVARFATVNANGTPTVVPICFATDGTTIYSALDAKPKSVPPTDLARVRNLIARPAVSLVVDDYAEDWTALAHLVVQGDARLVAVEEAEHATAISLLRGKYPQYETMAIEAQPVIAITPARAHFWAWEPDAIDPGAEPARRIDIGALFPGRHSVRAFRPDPVPRVLLEKVIDAARWAPSPHGTMPWRIAVLTQPEAKARLANAMGATWVDTLAQDGEPPEIVARRLANSHARIQEAPALILLCLYEGDLDRYPDAARQRAETTMAVQSLGAATENLLLAAYALGLDGGWMCAPLFCPDEVRAALDLPPGLVPHALLPLGYAARDPKRRPHLPINEVVVRWE